MGLWALDSQDADIVAVRDYFQSASPIRGQEGGPPGTHLACIEAQLLVLRPQRQGEGNKVYSEASLAFLDGLRAEKHEAWIAMEMIETPREVGI
jgi:glutathione synthase